MTDTISTEHVVQAPLANGTAAEAEMDDAACLALMHAFNRSGHFSTQCDCSYAPVLLSTCLCLR